MKVSVVIPIYNAQNYLRPCLESVLNQTLKEIEVICVDDGSTDSSAEIVEEYVEKDNRVSLIRQETSYAGIARNNGMKNATGEYIIFLDADDFFEKNMFEAMYNKCCEDNAQVCFCSGKIFDEKSGEFKPANHYLDLSHLPEETPFSAMDAAEKIFLAVAPVPWAKMFRRSYIVENQFEFQPLKKSNDLYFIYCAIACASSITYVNEAFVNCRIGNVQSLQSDETEMSFDFYTSLIALKKELQKRKIFTNFEKCFANIALSICFYNLDEISVKGSYIAFANMLREEGFYKLEVLGHSRGFFFNKDDYGRLIHVMEKTSEELWEEKINASEEKKFEKPNIDDWTRPIEITEDGSVKVSVIVPAYNVADFIEECVASVTNNTLKDIEIICVDDGSTDNTVEILNELAEKDSRIKIVSKENGGLSSARNAGIREAKGEYIYFLDGDDYIDPKTLEYLYAEAKADNLDHLFFGAKAFYDSAYKEQSSLIDYYTRKDEYNGIMTGREFFIRMSELGDFKPSACLQLIRKDWLTENNILFIEGLVYEDNPFTIQSLFYSKRVRFDNIDFYNRRLRENSIMTSSTGLKSSYGYFLILKSLEKIAEDNNFAEDPEFYDALLIQLRRTLFLSADYVREATEEEIMSFVIGLDEKLGMEYFFSVIVASNYRRTVTNLNNNIRNIKEKNLMDSFVQSYKDKETEKRLNSYAEKCRENEKRLNAYNVEGMENEKRLKAYAEKCEENERRLNSYAEKCRETEKRLNAYAEKCRENDKRLKAYEEKCKGYEKQLSLSEKRIKELEEYRRSFKGRIKANILRAVRAIRRRIKH